MKKIIIFLILIGLSTFFAAFARQAPDPVEPDYTKGKTMANPGRNYAALGPTGAHGYIWAKPDSLTNSTRTILIKSVDENTPADGVLQTGDVVLGIDGKYFDSDVRKALANAITEAETKKHAGMLVLTIWRDGKKLQAKLKLPILGSYNTTSLKNCKKTEAIIKAACKVIVKRGIAKAGNGVASSVDALGLLATGDKKFWPVVRKYCDKLNKDSKQEDFEKKWSWYIAYANLVLCEYYLLSKDNTVLPIIRTYSNRIVMGRSGVGTWGHTFANPAQNGGKPFGMPAGYGAMNQIGLTCTLSLVLAQKCGVDNKHITLAIEKSRALLSFYVDKGTFSYGDSCPWLKSHENNGVSSQAAVLFDILGDKHAATFFTRMTLASYKERESGHTGHFFNWNWGALGAARAGDEAATSFIKNTRWFSELERRPDGAYVYQYQLANRDHGKYGNWSTTGSRLLQHCLPLKQLYITGKNGGVVEPIIGSVLKEVELAQEIEPSKHDNVEKLLELLGHWSPKIRLMAAKELNRRETNVVEKLITMLESDNHYARYGACAGLRYAGRGSEKAARALIEKGVCSESTTMRFHALRAFMANPYWKRMDHRLSEGIVYKKTLAPISHLALPDLVKAADRDYPDEARPWTQAYVAYAVFGNYMLRDRGPAGPGLLQNNKEAWESLDIKLRIRVLKMLLQHESGNVRTSVSHCYKIFSKKELALLMPAIHKAVQTQAPSGAMFGSHVRLEGLKILAKHNIMEGLETGFEWAIRLPGWGDEYRKTRGFPVLAASYGSALKHHLPEIRSTIDSKIKRVEKKKTKKQKDVRLIKTLKEALLKIESNSAPKLITIEAFQQNAEALE